MKKLLSCIAILLSGYIAQAQTLTVNNTIQGDIYLNVYAVPTTCGAPFDNVIVMVPAYSSTTVNLGVASSWASSTVPVGPYELSYAFVSRDPSCPGSYGWGGYAGSCGTSAMWFDEVFVGDATCGFSIQECLVSTHSTPNCGGFSAGDVVTVQWNAVGLNITVDIIP